MPVSDIVFKYTLLVPPMSLKPYNDAAFVDADRLIMLFWYVDVPLLALIPFIVALELEDALDNE